MTPPFPVEHFADIALAAMALQLIAVALVHRRGLLRAVSATAPGAFLVLALRSALAGDPWTITLLWLAVSWPVHLIDLRARLKEMQPK